MEATATGKRRTSLGRHPALRGLGLVCASLAALLPLDAVAQAPIVTAAAPIQTAQATSVESDPTNVAQRLLSAPRPASDDAVYGQQLVETARAVGRKGDFETALELLTRALDHYQSGPLADEREAILIARMGITSAAWQLGKHDLVIEHAGELLLLPSNGNDSPQRTAARQFLARSLQQAGQYGRALEVTTELAAASTAAKTFAAEHALAIGGAALRSDQLDVAADAYRFYLSSASGGPRTADALLGLAWTAVLGGDSPEQAAAQLADFIAAYPDHHDVPHALQAQAKVLRQLGRDDDAERISMQVLTDHASSEAAKSALEDHLLSSSEPWPDAVRTAWLDRLAAIAAETEAKTKTSHAARAAARAQNTLSAEVVAQLLARALENGDDGIWQATVKVMVRVDGDGQLTFQVLQLLAASQMPHIAEHLAVELLGRVIDARAGDSVAAQPLPALPAACESACRWAGLMGRWSLLALVAEQSHPAARRDDRSGSPRRLAIDRLLAESLMQTRRSHEALPWWNALIDVQGANDFPTLLRGAEVATAHGPVEQAALRLQAASQAAAEDPLGVALVQMLEAELAVRRARMDEARELLSAIVRATDSATELRPRAQWLIGETYFLQGKYSEAIDQYRRVDALDAEGEWAAAALLQAGKAFEKLGRSREAATCYTALLSRFGDSPNAAQARSRLAHLGDHDRAAAPLRR